MKSIRYISLISIMTIAMMLSCKTEVTITEIERAQQELVDAMQGTWTIREARKENTVITDFNNFSITITDKSYSTQNGDPVWPANGTFDLATPEIENEFVRQDGRLFTASENSGTITITIIYQEQTARGEFGTYEFIME